MKKRFSSLVLALTMLVSMCAFAPINVGAHNNTIQYNNQSGTMYQVSPFYTVDAFKIVGSKSYCVSPDVTDKTLYVENACTLEAAEQVEIGITKVVDGTTLEEYFKSIWDEVNFKYIPFPGTIESYYISTMPYEQAPTYKILEEGSYIVSVTKGGDEVSTLVVVGNRNLENTDGFELYSNKPSLTVMEGEKLNISVKYKIEDVVQHTKFGISCSIEDNNIADIEKSTATGEEVVLNITAKSPGKTLLKISDPARGYMTTATITVEPRHNNVYTIYNVPKRKLYEGSIGGKDFYTEGNNFAFSDLYIDSYKKDVKDDGSCSISFDAYNCNYCYGIVEIYNEDNELIGAKLIDKFADANTSITESLFGNVGRLVNLATTGVSYQSSIISKKTSVNIENVPAGGYIRITMDFVESPLLGIVNSANVILNVVSTAKEIVAAGKENNFVMHEKFLDNLIDSVKTEAKLNTLNNFKNKAAEAALKINFEDSESAATFAKLLLNALEDIEWEKLLGKAAVSAGVASGENVFMNLMGSAGAGLKICFTIGSVSNTLLMCMDMDQWVNSSIITIQNPAENYRRLNKVFVQSSEPIDKDIALETYKIEGKDLDFLPEIVRKQFEAKDYVEYINISMIKDGKETQINSTATVTIPLSAELQKFTGKFKVYRVETDGTLTPMKMSILQKKGYVEFETDHFSIYAIVAEADADTEEQTTKSDIDNMFDGISDWARDEIEEAVKKKLIPSSLVFTDLRKNINRKEFAALAVELYESITGKDAEYGNAPFTDIGKYDTEIKKAYSLGITTGISETTFEPNTLISREQLATMLCRVFKKYAWDGWSIEKDNEYILNFSGVNKFSDDNEISEYARPSVYFMAKHNIINGVGSNTFAPKSTDTVLAFATREQAILMALRCYNNLFKDDVISNSQVAESTGDYENIYLDYAKEIDAGKKSGSGLPLIEKNNNTGIILADLNGDSVPEMFAYNAYMFNGEIYHAILERAFYIENNSVVEQTPWRNEYVDPESGSVTKGFEACIMDNLPGQETDRETFEAILKNSIDGNNIFGIYYVHSNANNVPSPYFYTVDYVVGEGINYTLYDFTADVFDSYEITDEPLVFEPCNNRSCEDMIKAALKKYKSK